MSTFDRADPGQDPDYCDGLAPDPPRKDCAYCGGFILSDYWGAGQLQGRYCSQQCALSARTAEDRQKPGLRLEHVRHLHCGGELHWHQRPYADSNQVYELVLRCETCGAEDPPADQREPKGAVCWTTE